MMVVTGSESELIIMESSMAFIKASRTSTPSEELLISPLEVNCEAGFLVVREDDPSKPGNWPMAKRVYHLSIYGLATFAAQLGSTDMSALYLATLMREDFNIEREVALSHRLCTFWVSHSYGVCSIFRGFRRKIGVMVPLFNSGLFSFAVHSTPFPA